MRRTHLHTSSALSSTDRQIFVCSCEGTMPLDMASIGRGCRGTVHQAEQLCRRELDRFRSVLETSEPITVGCTQEAPLFSEVAAERGAGDRMAFVNIRENAGWSADAAGAGPKMAALIASAAEVMPPVPTVSFSSAGVVLVYGSDEVAIEAARRLEDHLDVTVLLTRPGKVAPPRATEFPVLKGTIRGAKGHLGAFELRIDDYALPSPSSRVALVFGPSHDNATSTCDIVLDLSGGLPLFPAHEVRSGYLRADPRDPAAVQRAIFAASHLVGEFDKPRFVQMREGLCAHSRSRITGCTRCLDVCPTGAITPNGDHVAIDPHVCAGCGSCAAICPTGAAAYALPAAEGLLRRLRTLLQTYREAGGRNAIVLFHDGDHGAPLIDALAREGAGLPADVLPMLVNEVSQIGPEALAAMFAYGAAGAALLVRGRPKHDLASTQRVVQLANTVLGALGYGERAVQIVSTDDPDGLGEALGSFPSGRVTDRPASFLPMGEKRGLLTLSFSELRLAAPEPVDRIALAPGAPFGGLAFDVDSCTLCHACVGACPTNALSADPDRPLLAFQENLCVQCGLCASTCPENVITLRPQIDFAAWNGGRRVVKEEEPFRCITCTKPFGTRSTIEGVIAKLRDRHWMFSGPAGQDRTRMLQMCEDCRVEAAIVGNLDPHGSPRPLPRTSADYPGIAAPDGEPS
jgi:ferredoxin